MRGNKISASRVKYFASHGPGLLPVFFFFLFAVISGYITNLTDKFLWHVPVENIRRELRELVQVASNIRFELLVGKVPGRFV